MKVEDLSEETNNETIVIKILSMKEKETKSERGEGIYYFGLLGDDTGTMPYTAWTMPATIRSGDVVELRNFNVKKYNDNLRVYIDSKTDVILRPDDKIEVKRVYKEYRIKDLNMRDQYVTVSGNVSNVIEKSFEKDGAQRNVTHFTLEDETGSIRISLFDRQIQDASSVRIEGARLSEYKGHYRLTAGDRSIITPVKITKSSENRIYNIYELLNPVDSVSITGLIVHVGEKGGLVRRCNECRKTLDDIKCPEHPDAGFMLDLFSYFTVEDGTGDLQCTAGRPALTELLEIKDADLDPAASKISKADVSKMLMERLIDSPMILTGDIVSGTNGLTFRVRKIERMDTDIVKRLDVKFQEEFA